MSASAAATRYKELNVGMLRAFSECAKLKSFTAAAKRLSCSQPVVWQQVHALERELGVKLFDRRGRELFLTPEGHILVELANSAIAAMDSLRGAFSDRIVHVRRPLRVAGSPNLFTEDLSIPISEFCGSYPDVQVSLHVHTNTVSIELVTDGRADLAVVAFGEIATRSPLLTAEPLCERHWMAVVPSGHALAKKKKIGLGDLIRYPLVLSSGDNHWRRATDELFRKAGLFESMQVSIEVNHTQAARRFVGLGMGVTVMPEPWNAFAIQNTVTRPLADDVPAEKVMALWRRGAVESGTARQFVEFVKARLANHEPG